MTAKNTLQAHISNADSSDCQINDEIQVIVYKVQDHFEFIALKILIFVFFTSKKRMPETIIYFQYFRFFFHFAKLPVEEHKILSKIQLFREYQICWKISQK